MPGNINGLQVDIELRPTTAGTYCLANLGLTKTYTANSFSIDNTDIVPLPVELVSFKAQPHTKGVSLTWATASELDNKGFEVQVSTNSKDFATVGFVESKAGTTSIRQEYSFLDTKAVAGTRYYRLKQIDFSGKFEYSAIKAVVLGGGTGAVAAYPNPFEDVVVVKLNGTEARKVNVMLTNSMGRAILKRQEETEGSIITIDMSGITAKGIYILHVLDNGKKHSFKLMKR
ncbi:T9SS type A sorting domain-containing protein [Pontibacter sp. JH31]|uniref:T9SS type A sorting domain-containing protein n=2 Tax=Pontibacter aquaedesilientis TaxID=2766980 RepID=A0ABR7XGH1_9BACT|nr:T9SS type A sorting domain-containing protein [Pontibacter aquaedesilientis]